MGAGADLPPAQRPDEWADQPGTRAPHLWALVDDQRRSTLDLFQRGWVLLSENDRWAAATAWAAGQLSIPVTLHPLALPGRTRRPDARADRRRPRGVRRRRPGQHLGHEPVAAASTPEQRDSTLKKMTRRATGRGLPCLRGRLVMLGARPARR